MTKVALVGLRGAGKSTVGRALAALRGWPFVDQDDVLAERAGVAGAGDLLAALGEPAFRELEARVLLEVLEDEPLVLATGGGAVLRAENRALLAERARVVWLRAAPAVLAARVAADPVARPPLVGEDAAGELALLAAEREPLYREVAELVVDCGAEEPPALARQIARWLDGVGL